MDTTQYEGFGIGELADSLNLQGMCRSNFIGDFIYLGSTAKAEKGSQSRTLRLAHNRVWLQGLKKAKHTTNQQVRKMKMAEERKINGFTISTILGWTKEERNLLSGMGLDTDDMVSQAERYNIRDKYSSVLEQLNKNAETIKKGMEEAFKNAIENSLQLAADELAPMWEQSRFKATISKNQDGSYDTSVSFGFEGMRSSSSGSSRDWQPTEFMRYLSSKVNGLALPKSATNNARYAIKAAKTLKIDTNGLIEKSSGLKASIHRLAANNEKLDTDKMIELSNAE